MAPTSPTAFLNGRFPFSRSCFIRVNECGALPSGTRREKKERRPRAGSHKLVLFETWSLWHPKGRPQSVDQVLVQFHLPFEAWCMLFKFGVSKFRENWCTCCERGCRAQLSRVAGGQERPTRLEETWCQNLGKRFLALQYVSDSNADLCVSEYALRNFRPKCGVPIRSQ